MHISYLTISSLTIPLLFPQKCEKTCNHESIVNLSDHILSESETSLLNKGLKFIPTFNLDTSITPSIDNLIRSINTQFYFKNLDKPKSLFFTKKHDSVWLPPYPEHPEIQNLNYSLEMYKHLHIYYIRFMSF